MAEKDKKSEVKSVGIIVMTKIPSEEGLTAILTRRGKRNHEKDWEKESYPGACQVTAHGKLLPNENPLAGLFREIAEELGDVFFRALRRHSIHMLVDDTEKGTITFGAFIYMEALKYIRLEPSSGGLEFVSESQLEEILDLGQHFNKADGVDDLYTIAMFADEIKALKLAFEKISEP